MAVSPILLATVVVGAASGCTALFGLERPVLVDAENDDTPPGDARADSAADMADIICPIGYASIASSSTKYRVVTSQTLWPTAASDCADDGTTTHLVVLGTLDEYARIQSVFTGTTSWVGHSDILTKDQHLWVTQEPNTIAPQWASGEPNSGTDRCTAMDSGALLDNDCNLSRPYTCECDGYMNDDNRY